MNAHDPQTASPSFHLDLPPLEKVSGAPKAVQAFAAATLWLAMGVVGLGLVGGAYLGA